MAAIQDENVQLCLTILKQMAGMVQDARRAFGSNDACVVNRRELAGMSSSCITPCPMRWRAR